MNWVKWALCHFFRVWSVFMKIDQKRPCVTEWNMISHHRKEIMKPGGVFRWGGVALETVILPLWWVWTLSFVGCTLLFVSKWSLLSAWQIHATFLPRSLLFLFSMMVWSLSILCKPVVTSFHFVSLFHDVVWLRKTKLEQARVLEELFKRRYEMGI